MRNNDVYSQSALGSQPNIDQTHASSMSLQLNNLLEGDLIKTDDLWTREDDADYIDDYIESSLLDVLYNMHEVDKDILEETSIY